METTKSIVLFGDSLLGRFGKVGIDQLESSANNIIVYNCAAGGFTSEDGAKRAKFIAKLKPDYVVLSFGANDFAPWKKQTSEENFRKNIDVIIDSFAGSKIIFFPCPPVKLQNDKKTTNQLNNLLLKYYELIKNIVKDYDASIIDSQSAYDELIKMEIDYHEEDGLHLNEDGYNILIKEIVKLLQ